MMENRLALAPALVEFRRSNIDCLDLPRSSGDLRLRFDPRDVGEPEPFLAWALPWPRRIVWLSWLASLSSDPEFADKLKELIAPEAHRAARQLAERDAAPAHPLVNGARLDFKQLCRALFG
jgi:hypothetical protein